MERPRNYNPHTDPNPEVRETCRLEDMLDLDQIIHVSTSPYKRGLGHLLTVSFLQTFLQCLIPPYNNYELYPNTPIYPILYLEELTTRMLLSLVTLEKKELHNVFPINTESTDFWDLFTIIIFSEKVVNRPTTVDIWEFFDDTFEKPNLLALRPAFVWVRDSSSGVETPTDNPIKYFFKVQLQTKVSKLFIEQEDLMNPCERDYISPQMIVRHLIGGLKVNNRETFSTEIFKHERISIDIFVDLLSRVKEEEERLVERQPSREL
ncbi:hypothetical protein G7Y89_g7777 [Cudoniella acicularis]|uniref:Uncharacterized protein n=1 Tax=Cudoniella acicularis TaxID=354080 RepID=A0A8H4W480_9HELO|nr:hypothetical protein G7Y89_g7777 [Cudoniella acicularis]